jgi:hypothetical protein
MVRRDLGTGVSHACPITDELVNQLGGGDVGVRWRGQSAEPTSFLLFGIAQRPPGPLTRARRRPSVAAG